ncbi:MAG: hypothetical protein M3Q30_13220 [Actinomycetota bacterium]|nr:hypothetical protein [Actinomycetota bacterium]
MTTTPNHDEATAPTYALEPDDALVRALLGDTDIHERTTAMVDEVLALREQTDDLRRRAHWLLTEVALHDQAASDRVRALLALEPFHSAGTDDIIEGVGQLVAVLTGGERLHFALVDLGQEFQDTAENANLTPVQEVAAP